MAEQSRAEPVNRVELPSHAKNKTIVTADELRADHLDLRSLIRADRCMTLMTHDECTILFTHSAWINSDLFKVPVESRIYYGTSLRGTYGVTMKLEIVLRQVVMTVQASGGVKH